MDISYFPSPPPFFFLTVITHLFLGLLPNVTQKFCCSFSANQWKRNNLFPLPLHDPCSGLVLCGEVFDLLKVSEARLPEEHGANVVGNFLDSR